MSERPSVAAALLPGAGGRGVVVRQVTQAGEAVLGTVLPVEFANVYRVSALPDGVAVARSPDEPGRWQPTGERLEALKATHHAVEQSSPALRCLLACCGGLHLRPFRMVVSGEDPRGAMELDRPWRCGGWLPCRGCEAQVHAFAGGHYLGEVREDCSPYCGRVCLAACKCEHRYSVRVPALGGAETEDDLGAPPLQAMGPGDAVTGVPLRTAYTIRANLCCCGPHNNCAGGTCCRPDAVYNLEDDGGAVVGRVQRTYAEGGSGCNSACCRMLNSYNNYAVEMPPDAPPGHRALLVAGVIQLDYLHFESKGGHDRGCAGGGGGQ